MNSQEILRTLEKIGATNSPKEKQAILAPALKDAQFRFVVLAAVDPMITYGMSNIPAAQGGGDKDIFEVWNGDGSPWDANHVTKTLDNMRKRMLTGFVAEETLTRVIEAHNMDSRTLLARIIQRDLRCAVTATLVNKCEPGLVKTFECMLAHKFDPKRVKTWPQLIEPKIDGVRALFFVDGSSAKTFSRSGKEFTSVDHLNSILCEHFNWVGEEVRGGRHNASLIDCYAQCFGLDDDAGIVIDGELETGSFNETVSSARKKGGKDESLAIRMFDILPMSLFKNSDWSVPTTVRRSALVAFAQGLPADKFKLIDQYSVNSVEEIQQYYGRVRDRGLEGLIVKSPSGVYQRKRSHFWMKMKNEETVDLPVVGAFEGEGKYEGNLGGLIVKYGDVEVRVGGGFKDKERAQIWENWLQDKDSILNRLIEVEFHEKTPDGSLRHPRFVRWRDDKPIEEADEAA